MHSFEHTQREQQYRQARYDTLLELTGKLLIPDTNLSYPERMDTPIELDMTYGEWLAMMRDCEINSQH